MYKIIILDDEKLALEHTVSVLEQYDGLLVAGAYTEPERALGRIVEEKADIAFLGINMPGVNGFDIANKMFRMKAEANIVFLARSEEYAVKAFEMGAIDYVLKPFSEKRLSVTADRILKQGARSEAGCGLPDADGKKLSGHDAEWMDEKRLDKVAGWKNERIRLLKPNEIMYFYAEGKKTLIHTVDGIFESKGTLTDLEQRLDESIFFRCHRSYIINLDYVEYIDPWFNQTYTVKLRSNKEEIPVSRAGAKNLKRLITF